MDELLSRHLFFDLDGTLTDPGVGIVRSLAHALSALGVPVPVASDLERLIGPPLQDSLRSLLPPGDEQLVSQALKLYRARYADVGMFENIVYTGVPQALAELTSAGWTLSVVTSKPTVFASKIVAHFSLSEYFRGVHGSELSGERTNKAELIEHVLHTERISGASAIMIGDRAHDIVGARANHLRSAGVLWGYGSREELVASGADALFETIDELVSAFTSEPRAELVPAVV